MSSKNEQKNKLYFTISLYVIAVVAICTLAIKTIVNWASTKEFLSAVMSLLAPFFLGAFIAYLVHPLVKRFEKGLFNDKLHMKSQKLRQFLAILLSYIIVLGATTLFLVIVIPQIVGSLSEIVDILQSWYAIATDFVMNLESHYPEFDFAILDQTIDQFFPSIVDYFTSLITDTVPKLFSTSILVVKWLFNILIAIAVSCYVLADRKTLKNHFKRFLYAVFSEEKTNYLISTFKSCNSIFGGYIVGKFIDSLIIGILCAILLMIFKMPFVALISVIVGVTNMIPYFGPIIGAIPGFLIIVISNPQKAIFYLLLILALQQFDGNILGPKILGDSTGLKPLWIIFSITVGGWLWGPIGMFLGVPLFAVIMFLITRWVDKRLEQKNIHLIDYTKPQETEAKETTKKNDTNED